MTSEAVASDAPITCPRGTLAPANSWLSARDQWPCFGARVVEVRRAAVFAQAKHQPVSNRSLASHCGKDGEFSVLRAMLL